MQTYKSTNQNIVKELLSLIIAVLLDTARR